MRTSTRICMVGALSSAMALSAACARSSAPPAQSEAKPGRYAPLDKLPDIAGNWAGGRGGPDGRGGPGGPGAGRGAGGNQEFNNPDNVPLNEAGIAEVQRRRKLSAEGRPVATVVSCVPLGGAAFWGGPAGKEIALVPGRVLIWGGLDHDGNNLRRVPTDGRKHSADPDLTYLGESIGTWEGDTLVVDTIGFLPSVSAGLDIPNGGGMHMVERYRLTNPDTLQVEVEIDAPKALKAPYKVTRTLTRRRGPEAETREIVCVTGVDKADSKGFQYLDTVPPPDIELPPGVTLK